jgi:hypothetical protein
VQTFEQTALLLQSTSHPSPWIEQCSPFGQGKVEWHERPRFTGGRGSGTVAVSVGTCGATVNERDAAGSGSSVSVGLGVDSLRQAASVATTAPTDSTRAARFVIDPL